MALARRQTLPDFQPRVTQLALVPKGWGSSGIAGEPIYYNAESAIAPLIWETAPTISPHRPYKRLAIEGQPAGKYYVAGNGRSIGVMAMPGIHLI